MTDSVLPLGGEENAEENAKVENRTRRELKPLVRKYAPLVLVGIVYTVLSFLLFSNAVAANTGSSNLSLRYDIPLSSQQVAQAKTMLTNPELSETFVPAFWHSSTYTSFPGVQNEVVPVLYVDGDMQFVYTTEFLYGGYPSALEDKGIAISESLAWELFNTVEAVGQTIEWQNAIYTVRGVFSGNEHMMLIQVDTNITTVEGFEGVEIKGDVQGEIEQAAQNLATEMGLPPPSRTINSGTLPGIINALAFLPLVALVIWFLVKLFVFLHRANFWLRQVVWFGMLFALVILLPRVLELLPGWMIPIQWSNLNHWGEVFGELNARLTAWLAMKPSPGDVLLTVKLVWQVVLLVPALFALFSAIRRVNALFGKKEIATPILEAAQQEDDDENSDEDMQDLLR